MTKAPKRPSGLSVWYNASKQKRKEKEEQQRNQEPGSLKWLTLILTLVAMSVGMSILPLFPQPLPIFLAVLVAFITYQVPRVGMPIGGFILGLGLLYHLSELYFISFLGDTAVRVAFIVIWMALFIIPPALFNRYRSALAIDFGILAVAALFSAPLYFMAIPLIIASAVFFKKYVGFTVIYYVLLSVPLQIMQYYQYTVLPIVEDEWWLEAGSAPPLLVPLTDIAKDLNISMSQFRLYDVSQAFYSIAGQTTWTPDWSGRSIADAVVQYRDSIPGILMFAVIVVGLALTLLFFTKFMTKEGIIGVNDKYFLIFTATMAAAIFFVLLSALQKPLAFTADVSATTMVLGIFGTLVLTLPVLFIDTSPKQTTSFAEVKEKAEKLKADLNKFDAQLNVVKDALPVVVAAPEGKALRIQDSLNEILKNIELRKYDQSELDQKLKDIQTLNQEKDTLEAEVNRVLTEYQISANGEYSNWVGKLRTECGINIQTSYVPLILKDQTIEQRVEAIKTVLQAGGSVTRETIDVVAPIYDIIRPLYDPNLPEKCRAVEFANQKLVTKEAPWLAIDALYLALNNWRRQYGADIQTSLRYLKKSLAPIAALNGQADLLPAVFGDETPKILDYAKKAEGMRTLTAKRLEKEEINILDVVAFKDDIQAFLGMANDVLLLLYKQLIGEETDIDGLVPTKDYLWEKNQTLGERLKKATTRLSNPKDYKINQIMEKLPEYLSYVDEAVQTLSVYSERKEFLLNYPLAEAAIEKQLQTKQQLTPKDLPFNPQFAGEYLRLYYTQRYGEYAFDKDTQVLTRRPTPI